MSRDDGLSQKLLFLTGLWSGLYGALCDIAFGRQSPTFAYRQACLILLNRFNRNERTNGRRHDGDRNDLILKDKFWDGGAGAGKAVSGIRHMQRNCHM